MSRRRTTRKQDADFLARRLADASREWQPGDRCLALAGRGQAVTTVERIEGDIVHLANGDSMHRTRMRSAPPEEQP